MILFIIFGIVMYCLGDDTFQLFKIMCAVGLVWAILQKIAERAPIRRERRAERRRLRAIERTQREIERVSCEINSISSVVTSLFCDTDDVFDVKAECEDEVEVSTVEPTVEKPTVIRKEETDPRDFDVKELTIAQLQKRLNVLYSRMDKLKYVNGVDAETWEKCQKSKAYRGLVWDIEDTEQRLERAINNEKRKWTNA